MLVFIIAVIVYACMVAAIFMKDDSNQPKGGKRWQSIK